MLLMIDSAPRAEQESAGKKGEGAEPEPPPERGGEAADASAAVSAPPRASTTASIEVPIRCRIVI